MKNELASGTTGTDNSHGAGAWGVAALALAALGALGAVETGCGGHVEVGTTGGETGGETGEGPVEGPSCSPPYGQTFGVAGTQIGQWSALSLAGDGACGVVLAGGVNGPLDAGGGLLPGASGTSDVIVIALDAAGKHRWSKRFGDDAMQYAASVAVDSHGDVVIAGQAEGIVDFGGGALPSTGVGDLFIARFDAGGQHLWSKRFGSTQPWSLSAEVVLSPDGDLVVTGAFAGELDLGGGVMDSGGEKALFAARLRADGSFVWGRRFPATGSLKEVSTAVDQKGEIYLTGMFDGTLDLGAGVLTSVNAEPELPDDDMYLAKLGADGETLFGKMFGGAAFVGYLNRIAVTTDGHAVVGGMYWGAVDFGNGVLEANAGAEPQSGLFLVSFDAAGEAVWSKTFGDGGITMPLAMAASGTEVAFSGLSYATTIDLGGGLLTTGEYAGIVARFDGAGQHRGSAMFGVTPDGFVTMSGLVAGADHLVVGGTFAGSMDLGTGELSSVGLADAVVGRIEY